MSVKVLNSKTTFMMKITKIITRCLPIASMSIGVMWGLSSCDDSKSYAELLTDEAHAINGFLANQNVILDLPKDDDFVTGPDAPYYRLDEEGNVYMQIVNAGDKNMMAKDDELIYFRFTRYNLYNYDAAKNELLDGWGNSDDLSMGSSSFRFGNYTLSSSSQWGSGIQMPLNYVGMESEVNIVIRSQYGLSSEISQVIPYVYNMRYFKQGVSGYDVPDEQ